jgi:hypothetical protein
MSARDLKLEAYIPLLGIYQSDKVGVTRRDGTNGIAGGCSLKIEWMDLDLGSFFF